jgi:ribosomal-protein-alanine N-acetyltransferase
MIRTARLVLRRFGDADRAAFAALNTDERVMATIGPAMSREQSDAFLDRIDAAHAHRGFGLWCVDLGGACIGFTGLSVPWFRDGVEVGWRIQSQHWGQGYATEAAQASLADGFDRVGLDEVISFTAASNLASRRVMEKLGMRRDPDGDFEHPSLPDGHPLRPHVLYRISSEQHATRPG